VRFLRISYVAELGARACMRAPRVVLAVVVCGMVLALLAPIASGAGAPSDRVAQMAASCSNETVNPGFGKPITLRFVLHGVSCNTGHRLIQTYFNDIATKTCRGHGTTCIFEYPGGWDCSSPPPSFPISASHRFAVCQTFGGRPTASVTVYRAASGATVTQLAGVSCTSATACVAVGYTARGVLGRTVAFVPLAEIWNGSEWRIASTPDPAHYTGSQLRGVSCTSATACVAVGFSVLGTERLARRMTAFAERWNGVKWTLQPVAEVKNAIFTQLVGVSCTSPIACTAVGDSSGKTWASLVERWNGSVWKVQPTPHPRTFIYAQTFLDGVSCSSATACVAVGESDTLRGFSHAYDTYRSLAEHWNGRSWLIESTPRPQRADEAVLDGVSCVATSACTAVGSDLLNPSGTDFGLLAESWSGMKWSIQTAPEPASPAPPFAVAQFGGISCTSVAHCMAVGSPPAAGGYTYPGGDSAGVVAEQESGAGWVLLSTPTPAGVYYFGIDMLGAADGLEAVSCTSPTSCMAVGSADISSSSAEQLIERWNGVSWTIQATPTP